jgi:hypothetical protein
VALEDASCFLANRFGAVPNLATYPGAALLNWPTAEAADTGFAILAAAQLGTRVNAGKITHAATDAHASELACVTPGKYSEHMTGL